MKLLWKNIVKQHPQINLIITTVVAYIFVYLLMKGILGLFGVSGMEIQTVALSFAGATGILTFIVLLIYMIR